MTFVTYVGGAVAVFGLLVYSYFRIPSGLPKAVPAIPIYTSVIGLWSDMGQDQIYDRWLREPLEKYGAVRIWFAGRWNLLVTRPGLLSSVFRNEDIYSKAGSQKKLPWGVIAALVGDNIINSHGDTWKLYTSIMKPGIQRTSLDSKPLLEKSRKFVDILFNAQSGVGAGKGVLVNPLIQTFTIDAMGESFLDIDFNVSNPPLICEEVDPT
ncbi:MAG: hypothetical protein M1840_007086 [Geoglossum simile]|nr:MAG: hypothetical protein M1840_007086 [Geoglossum simile]